MMMMMMMMMNEPRSGGEVGGESLAHKNDGVAVGTICGFVPLRVLNSKMTTVRFISVPFMVLSRKYLIKTTVEPPQTDIYRRQTPGSGHLVVVL